MIFEVDPHPSVNPAWWRIPAQITLLAYTISVAHSLHARIAAGVLMGLAAVALQFLGRPNPRLRQVLVVAVTVLGLAACFAAPDGLAEIPVVIAASAAPRAFGAKVVLQGYTAVVTVAFGATVGLISHSVAGVLAGVGIPLLVQRSVEQQTLLHERDRAQALLAEVQAGRDAETQAAALRERGRIAREMHDLLAHSLAGLSVQLQAVRAVAAREKVGAAVLEPLDKAAALAKDGLAEARSTVSTLRDPVGLGLADLPALVDRHPGRATLLSDGEAGSLAPAAGHAVYRAVQESLTNAARNAPGSPVVVALAWTGSALTVTVTDDGPAPGRSVVTGDGTGLGLAGMAERVTEVGGSATAGPRPEGGWQTRIEVPVTSR